MALFDDLDLTFLKNEFKKRYDFIVHKLCGDGPATHAGKFSFDEADILRGLHEPDLVFSTLGLHRDHHPAGAGNLAKTQGFDRPGG